MKKILIALMLLGAICANTFAQEYDVVEVGEEITVNPNEVYLSVGTPSTLQIFGNLFAAIFTLGQADIDSFMPVTFTAGYNHYFCDNHLGVGGYVSYEQLFGSNMFTTQAKITGQYGWEHFKIYHSFSAGAMGILGNSSPQVIPMFDLTWLGLKLDFDNWNIFIDSSIGCTAFIKAGASFKF